MGFVMGAGAWLLFAALVGAAAGRRDRSTATYFMLALLLSPPVAGIWLWGVGRGRTVCPRCRAAVEPGAIACRFCGAAFSASSADFGPSAPLLIGLVFATVALTIVHATAFDMNVRWLVPLIVAALGAAVAVRLTSSAKGKSSRELARWIGERPRIWQSAVGLVAVCELLTLGDASLRYYRHRGVSAALAASTDCDSASAWNALSPDARTMALPDELTTIDRRQARCTERRRQQDEAGYVEQCREVSKHLFAGEITAADRVLLAKPPPTSGEYLAEPTAAFADRIARRALLLTDLTPSLLPCGPATRPAFLVAVSASVSLWSNLADAAVVPEEILRSIGAKSISKGSEDKAPVAPITEPSKAALHGRVEELAGKIASPKTLGECAVALALCNLDARFATPPGVACSKLAKTAQALRSAEDAKRKADEAHERARAARDEARSAAADRCRKGCDSMMPSSADDSDTRWDKCMERCSGMDKLDGPLPF
jgi:uncharacterized membrane protein YeaQ/YmgE (transglycosylase-associated protein family)